MSEVVTMDANQIGIAAVRRALSEEHLPYLQDVKPPRQKHFSWRWVFYPPLLVERLLLAA